MHYVLDKELKDAVQQAVRQHLTSFQPRPKRGRRPRRGGSGGGNTNNFTKFAIVVAPGKAVALDDDMQPVVPIDPADSEYDPQLVDDNDIPFHSAHSYGIDCPVGTRVTLHSSKLIVAGQDEWGGEPGGGKVYALLVNSVDELAQLTGFGHAASLIVPDVAGQTNDPPTAASIRWDGVECSAPPA